MIQIACDESGSEGENLMGSAHKVFVHASVNLSIDTAITIIEDLRASTKSQATELKSSVVLAKKHRPALLEILDPDGPLADCANVYFVDKAYFVTGKMIDLLVEEEAHDRGMDIVTGGEARALAVALYDAAPAALGNQAWENLLRAFNDLIRAYRRNGTVQPKAAVFISELDRVRKIAADPVVEEILDRIWESRAQAAQYEEQGSISLRNMEPMIAAMNTVAGTWRVRLGDVPFEFIADNHWTLDSHAVDALLRVAPLAIPAGDFNIPGARLQNVHLVDSKDDPRVQVADILAGAGRTCAALAYSGTFDDPLQRCIHPTLDYNGFWTPGSPLEKFCESAPLGYLERFVKAELGRAGEGDEGL